MIKLNMFLLDCFFGAGGISLGFYLSGWTPVCGIDVNQDALATYRTNFPTAVALQADLSNPEVRRRLVSKYRGMIDLVCAGPPCQGLSVRNTRRNSGRVRLPESAPTRLRQAGGGTQGTRDIHGGGDWCQGAPSRAPANPQGVLRASEGTLAV